MLVLSRKRDQSIIIDGRINVMVVEVWGDLVRLGVDAPRDIRVDRREVHELREKDKREVVELVHSGETWASILRAYPEMTEKDIRDALAEAIGLGGES